LFLANSTTSDIFNLHEVGLSFQENLGKVELKKIPDPHQVGEWFPSGQAAHTFMIYFSMPAQEVSEQKFFGKAPINILPIKPSDDECTYEIDKSFTKPILDVLQPPDAATPAERGTYFPQSPIWRSHKDPHWSCGWTYCANYMLDDLRMDENWMAAIVMPPNAEPTRCLDG